MPSIRSSFSVTVESIGSVGNQNLHKDGDSDHRDLLRCSTKAYAIAVLDRV